MLQERVSDLYSLVMEINKQIETISTNFNKGPESPPPHKKKKKEIPLCILG